MTSGAAGSVREEGPELDTTRAGGVEDDGHVRLLRAGGDGLTIAGPDRMKGRASACLNTLINRPLRGLSQ
jgi:hypothetical protein